MDFFEEEQPSFARRHRPLVALAVLAGLVGAVWFGFHLVQNSSRSHGDNRVMMVSLPPPPPPPPPSTPPPPTTPTPQEDRMITQDPVGMMEYKPDDGASTDAAEADVPGLTTGIVGDGPGDGFGLRAAKSGTVGSNKPAQPSRGGRWGWYAARVQSSIAQALRENKNTRYADFRVEARVWADPTGKITQTRLAGSTGNSTLDAAITNEVLKGLILPEPPPAGMPMPIVLRLTARPPTMTVSKNSP